MKRKFIIIISILMFIIICLVVNYSIISNRKLSKKLRIINSDQELIIKEYQNVKNINNVVYTKTIRKMPEGDITFINIKNNSLIPKWIKISKLYNLKVNDPVFLEKYNTMHDFSTLLGYDKLNQPSFYSKRNNILVSNVYLFNEKIKHYNKGNKSKIRELIDLKMIKPNDEQLLKINPDTILELYTIKCKTDCFKNQKEIESFTNSINKRSITPWLSSEGNYYKLPYSIEPFSREAYGINLGSNAEKKFLREYKSNNNVLYKILIKNTLYNFRYKFKRNQEKIWLTEYTSTWLKKDYNIIAPFVDTRFNEMIGYYLVEAGETLNLNDYKTVDKYYADYLLKAYKNQKIIKLKEGLLFTDYFSNDPNVVTHASFNHQLAIINYLFEMSIKYKNENYKNLALNLLKTLELSSKDWIRPNKDIWYQVDKNRVFSGNDYKVVTLMDLIYTQELLLKLGRNKSVALNLLLKNKYEYLKNINYELSKEDIERYNKIIMN